MKKKILFVHGFGVRKDARGMFTDIAKSLENDPRFSDYECVLTDLNSIDENTGNIHINPLSLQSEILQNVYDKEKVDSDIVIIAHSQGCVVAGITDFDKVEQIILLTPPADTDSKNATKSFSDKKENVVNMNKTTILKSRSGINIIIEKEFWSDKPKDTYFDLYKNLTIKNRVTFILARQDEKISNENKSDLEVLGEVIEINGNHNFEGKDREGLIDEIKNRI